MSSDLYTRRNVRRAEADSGRKGTRCAMPSLFICVSFLVLFPLYMWYKVNVFFVCTSHALRFCGDSRRNCSPRSTVRCLDKKPKAWQSCRVTVYEVPFSVTAVLKFAGLPAG